MSAYQRLDMRQGQSLVMTPQLQQAIKLLQLSNIELAEFVAEEIERNPLLERGDNAAPSEFEAKSTNPKVAMNSHWTDLKAWAMPAMPSMLPILICMKRVRALMMRARPTASPDHQQALTGRVSDRAAA